MRCARSPIIWCITVTGRQKQNGVVLTSGGQLSCKHIAHMVGPNNAADITSSVENVLKLCETAAAATVAMPAIGTGESAIIANTKATDVWNAQYQVKYVHRERWYWRKRFNQGYFGGSGKPFDPGNVVQPSENNCGGVWAEGLGRVLQLFQGEEQQGERLRWCAVEPFSGFKFNLMMELGFFFF